MLVSIIGQLHMSLFSGLKSFCISGQDHGQDPDPGTAMVEVAVVVGGDVHTPEAGAGATVADVAVEHEAGVDLGAEIVISHAAEVGQGVGHAAEVKVQERITNRKEDQVGLEVGALQDHLRNEEMPTKPC